MARLREIVDTYFDYRCTGALLQEVVQEVEAEVPYQIRRFDKPSSMLRWRMSLSVIDDFLRTEPEAMVNEYAQYFGLGLPKSDNCTVFDRYGRQVAVGKSVLLRSGLAKGIYYVRPDGGGETMKWIIE